MNINPMWDGHLCTTQQETNMKPSMLRTCNSYTTQQEMKIKPTDVWTSHVRFFLGSINMSISYRVWCSSIQLFILSKCQYIKVNDTETCYSIRKGVTCMLWTCYSYIAKHEMKLKPDVICTYYVHFFFSRNVY